MHRLSAHDCGCTQLLHVSASTLWNDGLQPGSVSLTDPFSSRVIFVGVSYYNSRNVTRTLNAYSI